jgi:hypothetical protein
MKNQTLLNLADDLKTSLIIRKMKNSTKYRKDLWSVKLEKISLKPELSTVLEEWAEVKHTNPNEAIRRLCEKVSFRFVRKGPPKRSWSNYPGTRTGDISVGNLYVRVR